MDELISVMQDLLDEIRTMNYKLDEMRGSGLCSIDDLYSKLDEVSSGISALRGMGVYDSISDICDKLEAVKGSGIYNSLSDVCDKIDSLDTTITLGSNY